MGLWTHGSGTIISPEVTLIINVYTFDSHTIVRMVRFCFRRIQHEVDVYNRLGRSLNVAYLYAYFEGEAGVTCCPLTQTALSTPQTSPGLFNWPFQQMIRG